MPASKQKTNVDILNDLRSILFLIFMIMKVNYLVNCSANKAIKLTLFYSVFIKVQDLYFISLFGQSIM